MSYAVALVVALGGTAEADQGGHRAIHSSSEIRASEPRIAADVQRKYDVGYSICQTVAPVGGADYPVANAIYPTTAAAHYFDSRGIHVEQSNLPKVTLIDAP
ncbi:MAG TPA: hypothetical protein VFR06_06070, partial [Gallionellaceae bacterium]|nr:hypothetical protein [Gallionellaceae bacterium]